MKYFRSNNYIMTLACLFTLTIANPSAHAQDVRIKDLVNVRGFRSNQVIGFGLIVGLAGTGDSANSLAKNRGLSQMMTQLGMKLTPEEAISASVAAVVVTGEMQAFMKNGDKFDVKVSSIGDAKSFAGGNLLMTPLKAGDGKIYAVAQGSVVVGQATGSGAAVLTSALVPNGAVVEREFNPQIAARGKVMLSLRQPDFTTSSRIADTINGFFKGFYAQAHDPVSVEVELPPLYRDRVTEFMADMEGLRVTVDQKAIVVMNEKTGTVVMGAEVVIGKVAIAHGDLSIQIGGAEAGKSAKTTEPPKTVVNIGGSTVGDLVESLNSLGVRPSDLVGIVQAVHAAGALRADIKFL